MPDELPCDSLNDHLQPLLAALGLTGAWLAPTGQAAGGSPLDAFGAQVTLHGAPDPLPEAALRAVAEAVRGWQALRAAREEGAQLRRRFDQAPHFTGLLAPDGTLLDVNETVLNFTRTSREAVLGRRLWELEWWQADPSAPKRLREAVARAAQGERVRTDLPLLDRRGRRRVLDLGFTPLLGEGGQVEGLIPEGRDLTTERQLTRQMQRQQAFLEAVLENVQDGIVACDSEGQLSIFNRTTREMHGIEGEDQGRAAVAVDAWAEHYSLFEADGVTPLPARRVPLFRAWCGETVEEQEMVIAPRGLPRRTVLASGRALRGEEGQVFGAVVAMHDISERKRVEEQLRHAALHDGLTGLPNRALLHGRLESAIQRFRRDPQQGYAVVFCDLDDFKFVNDAYGHGAGDRLLLETAARFKRTLRESDTIARLGGDEFAVLLDNPGDAASVMRVTQRLQAALAQPFRVMGQPMPIAASLGVTLASARYTRVEDALRDADTAMYRAKHAGKGRAALFDESMHAEVLERLTLERDLRGALEGLAQEGRALTDGQLTLHYQPILDLRDLRCVGFEALLRWTHPGRGPISPATFIPLAETSGLIVPLGRWVLDEAGRQLTAWRAAHRDLADLTVSVNVSGRQLHRHAQPEKHFLSRLPTPGIELEVTESTLLDAPEAGALLRALADRGVCLSLDDFGTGYASLSALERHPVTTLKIDRSFVAALPGGTRQRGIVQGVTTLAGHLDLRVIAEGIETPEQLRALRALGCTHGQGFLFARPLPAGAALAFALAQAGKGVEEAQVYGQPGAWGRGQAGG